MKNEEIIIDEAEKLLTEFAENIEIASSMELIGALELFISISARVIEKYAGNDAAVDACFRISKYIGENPSEFINRH
ncbi:hypothetical protein [Photobacterium piscicola]|uniref:hypothetical protein n=1 Tax=Photobacterium piscicola TaxID=1378299 RepID=UPI00373706E3